MYGQREIISCMVIVILVAMLNYHKSAIKRDKEIQISRRNFLDKQKIEAERVALQHSIFLKKMLQYSDRCYDVHALIYRPRDYDLENELVSDMNTSEKNYEEDNVGENKVEADGTEKKEFAVTKKEASINGKGNEKADTSSIVYVLVAILLGSLVKAALDLTKHYKKVY